MKNETQIAVRVTHQMLAELDEMRRAHPGLPSRAELVRRAVTEMVEAHKFKQALIRAVDKHAREEVPTE